MERFRTATARAAILGIVLKGGMYGIGGILSLILNKKGQKSLSKKTTVVAALTNTARYALFMGAYAGTYVGVDEAIKLRFGNKR